MDTELLEAVPILASLNIARTLEFYASKMGFAGIISANDYCGVERGGIKIHLWLCGDPELPKVTGCRVMVKNIEPLYHEYSEKGIIHPNGPLQVKPWGLREFAVLDCHGNLLTFGENSRN